MRVLRAAFDEALGLFVADWRQALTILAVLVVSGVLLHSSATTGLGFVLAALLIGQLIVWCVLDARRRVSARHRAG